MRLLGLRIRRLHEADKEGMMVILRDEIVVPWPTTEDRQIQRPLKHVGTADLTRMYPDNTLTPQTPPLSPSALFLPFSERIKLGYVNVPLGSVRSWRTKRGQCRPVKAPPPAFNTRVVRYGYLRQTGMAISCWHHAGEPEVTNSPRLNPLSKIHYPAFPTNHIHIQLLKHDSQTLSPALPIGISSYPAAR